MIKKRILTVIALIAIIAVLWGLIYYFAVHRPAILKHQENVRAVEQYYKDKVASFTEDNKWIIPRETDIAFIGDSLTDGYDVKRFYPEYNVANRGIGGDTTHGLLARLDISVYQIKPKVIVMLIGANNLQTMFEDYEKLITDIKENLPDTELVICSLTSMGREWGRNNHLAAYNNVKIRALASKHGCHFVDLYTPLLNFETNEIYEHYTTDGGHLTEDGYNVLTQNIKPVIDGILNKNSSRD